MAKPSRPPPRTTAPAPAQDAPIADPAGDRSERALAQGVRRQRQHIIDLTGEDPWRGGVAD